MAIGDKRYVETRYWNANGKGIVVVAVVTEGIDWAAYIGADNGFDMQNCINWTVHCGIKLSRSDAEYFFSDMKLPFRP